MRAMADARLEPCALAIAGLDPSGGAGIFADLRAFAAAKVWGCGAVAVLTVQTTAGLWSARAVESSILLDQVRQLSRHQNIRAIKIGALGSASNARAVERWLATVDRSIPVVFDPVTRATRSSNGALLGPAASNKLLLALAKRATVVTPNVPEAESMLGMHIVSLDDAERAARELVELGARAALVKGGHLPPRSSAPAITDVLAVGGRVLKLTAARLRPAVHGTGCVLASLIAGRLALHRSIDDQAIVAAVRWAKQNLARALAHPKRIGDGSWVIDP
jgi:hydroxymethylpyrimidine kinase/phosphomethylpyrimidine kinase